MMTFLKILFYTFWVFYLTYQVILLFNIKKHVNNVVKTMDEMEKEEQAKKDGRVAEKSTASLGSRIAFVFHFLFGTGAFFFRLIGLMTSNWFVFLAWLIWDIALSPVVKHFRNKKKIATLIAFTFFFEFLDVLLTMFVILNAFHFHISFNDFLSYVL